MTRRRPERRRHTSRRRRRPAAAAAWPGPGSGSPAGCGRPVSPVGRAQLGPSGPPRSGSRWAAQPRSTRGTRGSARPARRRRRLSCRRRSCRGFGRRRSRPAAGVRILPEVLAAGGTCSPVRRFRS